MNLRRKIFAVCFAAVFAVGAEAATGDGPRAALPKATVDRMRTVRIDAIHWAKAPHRLKLEWPDISKDCPERINDVFAPVPAYEVPAAMDSPEARLAAHVGFLCDVSCGGRATGTAGSSNAAFYIIKDLRGHGLEVSERPFTISGKAARNIEAFIPGTNPNAWIIVTAYYDGYGDRGGLHHPAADSNASGVAALLELASSFAEGPTPACNMLFVALDGHTNGLAGASFLWDSLRERGVKQRQVRMVVNLDTMGSRLAPVERWCKEYLIILGGSCYARNLEACNNGLGLRLYYDYYGSRSFTDLFYRHSSDQKVFLEHGIPSLMLTSGITFNTNLPADTPSTLDYDLLSRRLTLLLRFLQDLK